MKKFKERLEMEHLVSKLVTLHEQYAEVRRNGAILEIKKQLIVQIEELQSELKQFLQHSPPAVDFTFISYN